MLSDTPEHLAQLINDQTSPDMVQATVLGILQQSFDAAFKQRSRIDDLVGTLSAIASGVNDTISITATPGKYMVREIHATSGPAVFFELLAYDLYNRLWEHTSRAVTPDEENDRKLPLQYYDEASGYASLLARAFVLAPAYRAQLWTIAEDILVKGLFSVDTTTPEPEVFVAMAALLLGAGAEMKDWMVNPTHRGRGKRWLWYDDEVTHPEETWGWPDILAALPGSPEEYEIQILPDHVKATYELAKSHAESDEASWDSGKLAEEAFGWYGQEVKHTEA